MDRAVKKKWHQKNSGLIWGGVTLLFLLLISGFYFSFEAKTISVQEENISLFNVRQDTFEEYINISGRIRPQKIIQLVALEGGIVEKINVENGDYVNEGEELLILSNQSLQLDLINKETALLDQLNNLRVSRMSIDQNYSIAYQGFLDIEVALAKAERQYEVNKQLYPDSLVSKYEFLESKELYTSLSRKKNISRQTLTNDSLFRLSQIRELEFSMNLIKDNLKLVKKTLNNLSIAAPDSGLLSNFDFELGQQVSKGEKVGELDLKQGYLIRAEVDEHYISRIREGLQAEFDFNGKIYPLEIKKIYPKVTEGLFEIDLIAKEGFPAEIKLGQSTYVKVSLAEAQRSILLKKGPFFQTTGGNWVFVITESGVAEKREITIGKQNPKYYEVINGLSPGEQVIVSDYSVFGEADKVNLTN
jgi:HlyD family secretion protein